jgi:hypothetical protein
LFETVVRVIPVPGFVNVIAAFGMTAPLGSLTSPDRLPPMSFAKAMDENKSAKMHHRIRPRRIQIMWTLFLHSKRRILFSFQNGQGSPAPLFIAASYFQGNFLLSCGVLPGTLCVLGQLHHCLTSQPHISPLIDKIGSQ